MRKQIVALATIALFLAGALAGITIAPAHALAGPPTNVQVEGGAQNACLNLTNCTVSLTTLAVHDTIIVMVESSVGSSITLLFDSSGLTWTRVCNIGNGGTAYFYWAIVSHPLTADVINATANNVATEIDLSAFAMNGMLWVGPTVAAPSFQAAGLLCANIKNTGSASAPTRTQSTTVSYGIMIALAYQTPAQVNAPTAPTGFTLVPGLTKTPTAAFEAFTTPQTNLAVTWGSSLAQWVDITDGAYAEVTQQGTPAPGPVSVDTSASVLTDSAGNWHDTVLGSSQANEMVIEMVSSVGSGAPTTYGIGVTGNSPLGQFWKQAVVPVYLSPCIMGGIFGSAKNSQTFFYAFTSATSAYSLNVTSSATTISVQIATIGIAGLQSLAQPFYYNCQAYTVNTNLHNEWAIVQTGTSVTASAPGLAVAMEVSNNIDGSPVQCNAATAGAGSTLLVADTGGDAIEYQKFTTPGAYNMSFVCPAPAWAEQVIVVPSPAPIVEPHSVLLADDFLYKTQLPASKWTIDSYTHVNLTSGIYTQAGYLVMRAQSANQLESVHSTSPIFTPSTYSDFTLVKRKMTVTLFPFVKKESPFTANFQTGFSALYPTGAYPGTTPAGTPSVNNGLQGCGANQIGDEWFSVQNDGAISGNICDSTSTFTSDNLGVVNPALYTVLTIETSGVTCSFCVDNVLPGSSWVWFRIYQNDANNNVIASTDKNFNNTSSISPYGNANSAYAFASQVNSNSAATNQTSYVDFINVQNFGSPVCIFNCLQINLPTVSSPSILISGLAWVANTIGFGDIGLGWTIIVIASMLVGFAGLALYTKNVAVGSVVGILTLGLWLIAGVIPGWLIVFPIIVAGFMGWGIWLKFTGTSSQGVQSAE